MSKTPDQADLLKLPREKLKQLCKERGHTGYSKCTKPQLIVLLGFDSPSKFNLSMMTTVQPSNRETPSASASVPKKRLESGPSGSEEPILKKQKHSNLTNSRPTITSTPSASSRAKQKKSFTQKPHALRKSVLPVTLPTPIALPHLEKQSVLPPMSRPVPQPPKPIEVPRITPNLQSRTMTESGTSSPAINPFPQLSRVDGGSQPSKKFLDPRKNVPSSYLLPPGLQNAPRSANVSPLSNSSNEPLPSSYLDFSVSPAPALAPISMPPSISDRKRVRYWSIILSGISNKERSVCILVSRMFRYAVYLSASAILSSRFTGKRLEDVTRVYSPSTFNFWPYLRAREAELSERRNRYLQSFLRFFYKTFEPINRRLWKSPDNPKQYAVAVRFVMAKFWFALSKCPGTPGGPPWLHSVVVDASEVVANEIWEITTTTTIPGSTLAKKEIFYVLEPTCEVIGRAAVASMTHSQILPDPQDNFPIRVDWSEYVTDRILSLSEAPEKKLLDRVQWAHYEEYQNGISRHFLTRTRREGEAGELKRRIAEKYILASVVENSVSGPWRSVQEMAYETFVPSGLDYPNKRQRMTMKMYLSAHHHVESVHFETPNKRAFHPAVATVQTLAREYYILRDNGMLIGTEEDGVSPLWQALLKCDESGLP